MSAAQADATTEQQAPAEVGLDHWPSAAAPIGSAQLKTQPADFQVTERPLPAAAVQRVEIPGGESQRLLSIRKSGVNTAYVAQLLARWANVADVEVGYAGRKDRHALTQQWFSLPDHAACAAQLKHGEFDAFASAHLGTDEHLTVVSQAWQPRKLRVGALQGNDFQVVLRDLKLRTGSLADDQLQAALGALRSQGVPNYFGSQRFGHDNLASAIHWLAQRSDRTNRDRGRKRRHRSSKAGASSGGAAGDWQRSTLRSYLFNLVLAARVTQGTHNVLITGDVPAVDEFAEPTASVVPTGPLWGRGRSATSATALTVEAAALAPHGTLCDGLEYTGLVQQRRALCVWPTDLQWERAGDVLTVRFGLPPGAYATVVLAALFDLTDVAAARARTDAQHAEHIE